MKKDYDKKLFRLIKILNLIQDARKTNTAALAAEFNISRRTAQRDILRLVSAGFPIVEDETENGSYRFYEGYTLRGLRVSDEEVSLLISLCDVARQMGGEFATAYKTIFAKVMNTREWDSPFFVMLPKAAKSMLDSGMMKAAREAIEENKRVRVQYETPEKGRREFVLEPLKLIYTDGFWYLVVRVPGRDWIAKYRLDRIRGLEALGERFKPPTGTQRMLQDAQNVWFNEKRETSARIRVAPDAAPFFADRSYFPLQKVVKRNKDGSLVIETRLCHHMEAIPLIQRWMPYLTVLSPKALADEIKKNVSAYLKVN